MADSRILKIENSIVTFSYKDYRREDGQNKPKVETMNMKVLDFIGKFLQHLLPKHFQKVRYYGILASMGRKKLQSIQSQLQVKIPLRRSTAQIVEKLIGAPIDICRNCGASDFVTKEISPNPYWIFDNCKGISQVCRPPPRIGSKVETFDPIRASA